MSEPTIEVLEERIAALDRFVGAQFAAQADVMQSAAVAMEVELQNLEKAALKSERAIDHRFHGVNEFRQALSEQGSTFATNDHVDSWFAASASDRALLRSDIATLRVRLQDFSSRTELEGRFKTLADDAAHISADIAALRLHLQDKISREELSTMVDTLRGEHTNLHKEIDALDKTQARAVGLAIGASTAVSMVTGLVLVVLKLATGT